MTDDTPRSTPPEVLMELRRAQRHSARGALLGRLIALEMLRTLSVSYDPDDEDALVQIAGQAFADRLTELAARQNRELQNAVDILSTDLGRHRAAYRRLVDAVLTYSTSGGTIEEMVAAIEALT